MINDAEQIRNDIVASTGNSQSTTVSSNSDVKIKDSKVYDTSSPKTAFSGLSAGDVIMMSGWDYSENNRIFTVTEVESSGEWFKVDKRLINEGDAPAGGVTVYDTPESLTVSGVTVDDTIVDVLNFNSTSSSPTDATRGYFAITDADNVSSFAETDSGDDLQITWADLSKG